MILQTIVDIFTILAAGAAAVSLYYLAQQIKVSIEQEKVNRSWDCLKLYMDPSCQKVISSVHVFLHLKKITPEEVSNLLVPTTEELEEKISNGEFNKDLLLKVVRCLNLTNQEIEKIKNNLNEGQLNEVVLCYFIELRSRVSFVQNLFEIIGALYNNNQLNKKIIKDFFKSISIRTYKALEEIIKTKRESAKHKQPSAV